MYKLKSIFSVAIFCLAVFCFLFLKTDSAKASAYESTFTSRVMDNYHSSVDYGTISWGLNVPASTSLVFKVRAGNVVTPDGTWTAWSAELTNGNSLDAYDGLRYIQYNVVLGTNNLSATPTVYDVLITTNTAVLTSSIFDSQDSKNIINSLSWSETLAGTSNVVYQIRSSADNATWTSWMGPSGGTESWFSDPNGGEQTASAFRDQTSDRYFQYRAILIANVVGGTDFPITDNVNVDYELPTTAMRTYESTFTSSIKDTGASGKDYLNVVWTDNVLPNTSLSIKVRTDSNSNMSTAPAWSTCDLVSNNTDISNNNCVDDGERYFQYQVVLGTDDLAKTPVMYDLVVYYGDAGSLISSPYDSTDSANALGGVSWEEDETLQDGSQTKIYLRTGADATALSGASWTEVALSTPSSLTTGCEKNSTAVSCDQTIIPAGMKDGTDDRYFQYKLELSKGMGNAPTVDDIQMVYVVNGAPQIQNVTASPDSSGNVNIAYEARDPDTSTATLVNRYKVTPSFQYSIDGGTNWTNITAGCLGANDLDQKTVEETNFLPYSAVWDPGCESGIEITTYETDTQIKAIVNDGEAANNTAILASTNFTLDTKPPVITDVDLDASVSPAQINITSSDDSTYQMKLAQGEDSDACQIALSSASYETYNATPTITPAQDPFTICLQLKDQYNNESSISYTTSPETPTAFMVQDTTNTLTTPNEFRLFIAWKVSTDPNFNRYELYRSTDNSTFNQIFFTYTQSTNSYPDNTVVGDTEYFYKVKTIDSNSNQSFFSETVQAKADGIQNYGEGGGGTSTAPPIISDVQIPPSPIFTSQATITWSTDVFSNSTVGYSITPGSFTTEVGSDTMYDNSSTGHYGPHTVVLTNLTPDTDYYFQVKSTGTNAITGTDDNADNNHLGYHFKTLPGPKITSGSVLVSKTTNTSATINWITDIAASSKINYSTFSDMSNAENFLGTSQDSTNHEVTITGLLQGTKYYFYAQSTYNGDTATDNNQYPINSYYSFTTTQDLIAPTITFNSNTDISKTTTTAKINFTTSEQSTSTLEYGTDTSYGTTLTSDNLNINQVFDLEELTPNTTYHFKITATDENSNPNTNSNTDYTFTTNSEETPDTTGPTISDIVVSDIKYDSAVVRWVTDVVGNSLVDYGIAEEYAESKGNASTESVTVHEVLLNGLNSVTTYYFKVSSRDSDDNLSTQNKDDSNNLLTFTTTSPTEDVDADGEGDQLTDIMSQIQDMIDNYYFTEAEIQDALSGLYSISITSSGPSVDITDTTATFSWTTNRPAIGKIYYWQDTDNEDTATSQAENITAARTDHEIIIKNLNANTQYNYYAYSEGLLGTTTQSENKSFSTGDTASLSGISISNLTLNSADISWTTTGSIDSSQLEYGESIKYGKSDKGKTTSNLHTVNLTNLNENTTYHLRVTATDSDGQTLTSDDYSFTTTSLPVISNVTIKDIQIESATINWQTNVKTDSRVEFKKDGETKGTTNGELEAVTDHSFTLTNLFPGTRYTFKVSSKDAFNNESSSEEQSFTTEEDLNAPTITNVKSDTTVFPGKEAQIQTIISWNTDKDSNSILAYREGVEKDPNLIDQLKNPDITKIDNWKLIKKQDLTKNHLFVLTDLKPASVYQFRTASFDKHGNVSISENYSLLTPTKQQSVLDLIISNFESTFGWVKKIGN
ncbi:MAG: fibronectin type III domain-containing protein [Candidatus Moraniibacteriota bacterium]